MSTTRARKSSSATKSPSSWPLPGVAPFKVQEEGERLAGTRRGFLWLHEQGLGKTATALANFYRCKTAGIVDTLVVICPNSLKGNWPREAKQWGIELNWNVWPKVSDSLADINGFVINYEVMIGRGSTFVERLCTRRKVYLVLDECHRIKNPKSKVTRELLGNIGKLATIKRGLTGTPMTQSVEDLWPQLRFAGAIQGMKATIFRSRYGVKGGFMGKKIIGVNEDRLDELWKLVDGVSMRALKRDWLDLPPKLYREQTVELPPVLKKHYLTMVEEFLVDLDNGEMVTAEMIVSQLVKLQQISSGFIYKKITASSGRVTNVAVRLMLTPSLPKFQALMDVIEANGTTSKTIVFCHFAHTAQELIRYIGEALGEVPACLVGGMDQSEVEDEKARFNGERKTDSPRVLVAQISAGKEGHTLLGDREGCPCHTIVFYEHNFNLGDRLQAEDRAHRIGQVNPVLYIELISSPVEATTRAAIVAKKSLVDWVVDHAQQLKDVS